MQPRFNTVFRRVLLGSRWAMAPFFLGLIAALLVVLAQFFRDLAYAVLGVAELSTGGLIVIVLKLVDLVLLANLVLMIIVAGIDILLPRAPAEREPQAEWTGLAHFAELKLKIFASISAIAAVDLLEDFILIETMDKTAVVVEILILLAFVVAGILLAWMDRLSAQRH